MPLAKSGSHVVFRHHENDRTQPRQQGSEAGIVNGNIETGRNQNEEEMKKPRVIMIVTKEVKGFSATTTVLGNFIGTQGDGLADLKKQILDAVNLAFKKRGFTYAEDEIILKPDLQSFFTFYRILNAKALSERIGMNQSLLAQYIKGIKKPSTAQAQRILNGVKKVGKELASIQFLF